MLQFCSVALLIVSTSSSVHGFTVNRAPVHTEFIILHNNDMHARFEQTSVSSGKCSPEETNTNKCYGGFARIAYEVRKYRDEAKSGGTPALYLNAGDTYTGTPWFTVFKDNITAAFLNKLHPDAISLGNHELDENVAGLVPFLNSVEFPVLAANLNLTGAPEIAASKNFAKSTVLDVKGTKVGIIGYLTPDTKILVSANPVEFFAEEESIDKEAEKLKAEGVKIIIALGHSGYQKDKEIAAKCSEVDIVIGGHTNTFLYNGSQPSTERIDGPYPTIVKQKNGKMVPVIQAYAFTKYLGRLHVQFDISGNLIEYDGTPLLLDAQVPRENDLLQLLEVYRPNITALEKDVVGHTKVPLIGNANICRRFECNLGNLVTDAMIFARVLENQGGTYWTDAPIAFIQGGGLRNSIDKRSDGSITKTDVMSVLPFNNDLYVTKIKGSTIRKALEHSAELRDRDSNGGFLQMSGVNVVYDFSKERAPYVTTVEVRCAECDVPAYEKLINDKLYGVIVTEFLLTKGDGHIFTENDGPEAERLAQNEERSFIAYLNLRKFVYPELDGRIKIIERNKESAASTFASSLLTVLLLFVIRPLLNNH